MRHLNSIPGFEYVMVISETGQRSNAKISEISVWLGDCILREGGLCEGKIVHYFPRTHAHGLQIDERVTFSPPELDPHALLQQEYGLVDYLERYPATIDEHVETCETCRERIIGFTKYLPKLRARMTVRFPESVRYDEQLKQLKRGQCLPCGCEVIGVAWTQEHSRDTFQKALAGIMQVSEEDAKKIPDWTRLRELPLSTKSLRRLRDMFWFPDGSSMSAEVRDAEEGETVLQLPETVGDFIKQLLSMHSGMSWMDCSDHWSPG